MKILTRAELEREKIDFVKGRFVFCDYRDRCTRAGNYMRCFTHLDIYCPFYNSYREQDKLKAGFDTEG